MIVLADRSIYLDEREGCCFRVGHTMIVAKMNCQQDAIVVDIEYEWDFCGVRKQLNTRASFVCNVSWA